MLRVGLHELHPFRKTEIAKLPRKPGVYVLFLVQNPIYAGSAADLRSGLGRAKAAFPKATHFSAEAVARGAVAKKLRQLRDKLQLVRKATFVGHKSR
jgi:excinuclease UvrABC nuclease subunit